MMKVTRGAHVLAAVSGAEQEEAGGAEEAVGLEVEAADFDAHCWRPCCVLSPMQCGRGASSLFECNAAATAAATASRVARRNSPRTIDAVTGAASNATLLVSCLAQQGKAPCDWQSVTHHRAHAQSAAAAGTAFRRRFFFARQRADPSWA